MDKTKAYFGTNSSMTFDSGNTTRKLSEYYLSLSKDERKCLKDQKFWAFLLSSVGSFVVIVLSILIWRAVSNMCFKLRYRSVVTHTDDELTPGLETQHVEMREVRQQKGTLWRGVRNYYYRDYYTSAKSWGPSSMGESIGNIFLVLLCLASIGQVVIYFIDINKDPFLVEICKPLSQNLTQQIDLGLNIFFLAFFVKRFLEAPDKLILMFDCATFEDICLIPPSFLAVYMQRSWIGLRVLAALRFMNFPELFWYLRIIKTPATYHRVEPFAIHSTTLMCTAGVVHLLENMGYPWTDFTNAQHLSYLKSLYAVIFALLTAGVYHSYCTTFLGRFYLVESALGINQEQMDKPETYFGTNSSMTFASGNTTGNLSEYYLSLSEDERKCLEERKYWAFLLSSIGSIVVIVLSILIWRAASNICFKLRYRSVVTHTDDELTPVLEMQQNEEILQPERSLEPGDMQDYNYRSYITSARSWGPESMGESIGNIFLVLLCLASIGQVVVYFIDISKDHFLVEICAPLSQSLTQQIDLGLNIFFLAFFVKRFFEAPDKLIFMFDYATFNDLFLIPPSFLAIYMERSWIGLRLIAAPRLMRIPELLYYLRVIKTPATYYRVEPFAIYSTTLMCATGVIHLLENMGEAYTEFTNAHHLSYLQSLYSVILALLTAGIYHSYCITLMGRCFLVFLGLYTYCVVISCIVAYRQRRQDERYKGNDKAVNV